MATMLVLPALPDFQKRYPELQLDIGVSDRPVDLLGDRVDCVIRGGTLSDPSLIARRLGSLEFVTCATPEYLASHGTPLHPSDLENGHQMVRYFFAGTHRRLPVEFVRANERITVEADYFVAVNDSNALLVAALAGMGVLQTLRFMAEPHFKSGALIQLLTGLWSRTPSTSSTPPTDTSAPACGYSSIGWLSFLRQEGCGNGLAPARDQPVTFLLGSIPEPAAVNACCACYSKVLWGNASPVSCVKNDRLQACSNKIFSSV
jgi:hypothetical protein